MGKKAMFSDSDDDVPVQKALAKVVPGGATATTPKSNDGLGLPLGNYSEGGSSASRTAKRRRQNNLMADSDESDSAVFKNRDPESSDESPEIVGTNMQLLPGRGRVVGNGIPVVNGGAPGVNGAIGNGVHGTGVNGTVNGTTATTTTPPRANTGSRLVNRANTPKNNWQIPNMRMQNSTMMQSGALVGSGMEAQAAAETARMQQMAFEAQKRALTELRAKQAADGFVSKYANQGILAGQLPHPGIPQSQGMSMSSRASRAQQRSANMAAQAEIAEQEFQRKSEAKRLSDAKKTSEKKPYQTASQKAAAEKAAREANPFYIPSNKEIVEAIRSGLKGGDSSSGSDGDGDYSSGSDFEVANPLKAAREAQNAQTKWQQQTDRMKKVAGLITQKMTVNFASDKTKAACLRSKKTISKGRTSLLENFTTNDKFWKDANQGDPVIPETYFKLKDYQKVGVRWLQAITEVQGLGAILADEMGLGKTAQTLTYVEMQSRLAIKKTGKKMNPVLIVAPVSLLRNWENEVKKWTKLTYFRYHASTIAQRFEQAAEYFNADEHADILFTTPTILASRDDRKAFFGNLRFSAFITDEAHFLKTDGAKRVKEMCRVNADTRILLTGTPIQNSLSELCNLLWFCSPSIFAPLKGFFNAENQTAQQKTATAKGQSLRWLQNISSPFLLRRMKSEVLKELPRKDCIVYTCKMHPYQRTLYNAEIAKWHPQNKPKAAERPQGDKMSRLWGAHWPKKNVVKPPSVTSFKNAYFSMRRLCNAPLMSQTKFTPQLYNTCARLLLNKREDFSKAGMQLVQKKVESWSDFEVHQAAIIHDLPPPFKATQEEILFGGKVQGLLDILSTRRAKKTIIFSQYTQYLDVLESALLIKAFRYVRLDGKTGTDERQILVDKFSEEPVSSAAASSSSAAASSAAASSAAASSSGDDNDDKQKPEKAKEAKGTSEQTPAPEETPPGMTPSPEEDAAGSPKSEEVRVDDGQSLQVFLLSTKAGGTGLNLVAADMVILMDMDYNPQNNRQAEDRIHRLGQKRDVKVVYMLMEDTIEEDILKINLRKMKLDAAFGGEHKLRDAIKQNQEAGGLKLSNKNDGDDENLLEDHEHDSDVDDSKTPSSKQPSREGSKESQLSSPGSSDKDDEPLPISNEDWEKQALDELRTNFVKQRDLSEVEEIRQEAAGLVKFATSAADI